MDPHENEYRAAVAAMPEHTVGPSVCEAFAIGTGVTFRLAGWPQSSFDDGDVIGHHNGKLLVETASDIVEVDPRPWPVGNVLPW
jgi:hypothetical protein